MPDDLPPLVQAALDAAEEVALRGEEVDAFTTLFALHNTVAVPTWAFNALKAALEKMEPAHAE